MAKPIVKEILSWVITIVVAVVLALLIKRYVFCIANVPTGSMIPAIQINDKIVISTVSLYFQDIEVDDGVPFVLGGPVGQIAEHHVYRFVGDGLDLLKAVAFDDGVEKRLN